MLSLSEYKNRVLKRSCQGKYNMKIDHAKAGAIIREICATFNLSKREFCYICNMGNYAHRSRLAMREIICNPKAYSKIFDLLLTAKAWQQYGFKCSRCQLHDCTILDGESIFDMLSDPFIDEGRVLFIGNRLNLIQKVSAPLSS
jgi:hypothetical protein